MKRLICIILLFFSFNLVAQVENKTVQGNENTFDEVKLLYRNESTAGVLIHTNGLGINYRRGKHVTGFRKRLFEMEVTYYRHNKEFKTTNPSFDNAKGYFYGKLNSAYLIRPGIGFHNVIYTKPEKNGVEIRYVAVIGASLMFLKPVYLEILKDTGIPGTYAVVTEKYDPDRHFQDNIYGRAPFMRGFGDMSLQPGGYLKFGLNFEYGPVDTEIKSLETGVILDVYAKDVPLMATQKMHPYLLSLYLNFSIGKKWF